MTGASDSDSMQHRPPPPCNTPDATWSHLLGTAVTKWNERCRLPHWVPIPIVMQYIVT